jgi:hypothetical protein
MIILRRTAYYMRALGREALQPPNVAWLAANAYELNAIFTDIERAARNNHPNICSLHHPAVHRSDIRQYLEAHGFRTDYHTIAWDHATHPPTMY